MRPPSLQAWALIGLLLIGGCGGHTPTEIRARPPTMVGQTPGDYLTVSRCIARGYENTRDAMLRATSLQVRDYPAQMLSELMVDMVDNQPTLIAEVRAMDSTTSSIEAFYIPPLFGAEMTLDRLANAIQGCGGVIVTRRPAHS